jgi:hypothetical protein
LALGRASGSFSYRYAVRRVAVKRIRNRIRSCEAPAQIPTRLDGSNPSLSADSRGLVRKNPQPSGYVLSPNSAFAPR